jgi:hypothetical protein
MAWPLAYPWNELPTLGPLSRQPNPLKPPEALGVTQNPHLRGLWLHIRRPGAPNHHASSSLISRKYIAQLDFCGITQGQPLCFFFFFVFLEGVFLPLTIPSCSWPQISRDAATGYPYSSGGGTLLDCLTMNRV